jgi:zinc/manganese transport system substrate-binding protein
MVRNIENALVEADPDGADVYHAGADDYVAQLQELDAEVSEQLSQLTNRQLVTNHEAFTYYAARYDLEFVGAIIPSFDTQAELSTQEVNDLVAEIRATGVKAVFSETSLPPDTAQTIASEAGVEVVTGDEALYGDSLGPEGSPGATYIGAIRHNTETIVAHLG